MTGSGTAYVIDQLGMALENSHAVIAEQRDQIVALEAEVRRLTAESHPGSVPLAPEAGGECGNTYPHSPHEYDYWDGYHNSKQPCQGIGPHLTAPPVQTDET